MSEESDDIYGDGVCSNDIERSKSTRNRWIAGSSVIAVILIAGVVISSDSVIYISADLPDDLEFDSIVYSQKFDQFYNATPGNATWEVRYLRLWMLREGYLTALDEQWFMQIYTGRPTKTSEQYVENIDVFTEYFQTGIPMFLINKDETYKFKLPRSDYHVVVEVLTYIKWNRTLVDDSISDHRIVFLNMPGSPTEDKFVVGDGQITGDRRIATKLAFTTLTISVESLFVNTASGVLSNYNEFVYNWSSDDFYDDPLNAVYPFEARIATNTYYDFNDMTSPGGVAVVS